MKMYVIDELRPSDHEALRAYLAEHCRVAGVEGIFWIPLETNLMTETQAAHRDCQPFYFALELTPDRLACELLVRSEARIRCACVAVATTGQRNWLIDVIDGIFDSLGIKA